MGLRGLVCKLRWGMVLPLVMTAWGCITQPQHPSATQPSTAIDLATTQPGFWIDQPAGAYAQSPDFQKLWTGCEDVARDYLFKLDRVDYREGVLTTQPLTSAQWFEFWRGDTRTSYDQAESSIATIRRTIRFEFSRQPDQTWRVSPKVLVERQDISEKRITSVVMYRSVFAPPPPGKHVVAAGSRESDQGIILPERYWYPLRRDAEFEQVLAQAVEKKLRRS